MNNFKFMANIRTHLLFMVLSFIFQQSTLAQFSFSNSQLNNYWTSTPPLVFNPPPLTFGPSIISGNGITIIDTPDGKATYSFIGGQSVLTVDTQGDIYTSSVENVQFIPGNKTQTLSGENLSFSSTTNDNRTDIDRFSFSGGSSEFRFKLNEFHTTGGDTNWGGESLTFTRRNDTNQIEATKVYIRNSSGEFVEIGEANYSEKDKRLELTSIIGQHDNREFSADQIELMREGETNRGKATNLFIAEGPGEFIQVGTADLQISPDRKSLSLTSISGAKEGYDFSATTFNYVETEDEKAANATGVFVRNADGDFIRIGDANFSETNNRLEMTSVIGQRGSTNLSADQLEFIRSGDTNLTQGTKLFISQGSGEFVQVGTARLEINPDRTSLSLTEINGESRGYNFSAGTFNATETNNKISASATGIFIRNANGDFIQIGEGEYSEANNSLKMTSLLGHKDGTDFSADQLELMRQGNSDIGKGTNIFISRGAGEFIRVGSADFISNPQSNKLWLTDISGESNGFRLSADSIYASNSGDNNHLSIYNGEAIRNRERLTFGNAVVDSNGDRVSADVNNLFISNGDLSYSADRFHGSTNGESVDINTAGILKTGGNNIDLTFNARGVNSVGVAGPGKDGGILIERSSEGRVVKAEGSAFIGTTDDGGISEIGVSLGNDISFSAVDADGNAKELIASFSYDETAGKFYLKTVFKEGDKTEIKIMPFKFTSEKVGEDAVAALSASLEKQDIQAYLNTMTSIIDLERVNDFLAVGANRMQVRIGREAGLEFYYANDNLGSYNDDFLKSTRTPDNLALGVGLFNRGASNQVHSGGVLVSSDSSLRYHVEAGTLSFNGVDLPDRGTIPLTIGTYYRYEDDEGNAIFGTLGTSLAELGSVSAGVTIERRINDYTTWNVGVAGNSDGDYAARTGIEIRFGKNINNSPRSFNDRYEHYDPRDAGEMARSIYEQRNSVLGQ